MGSFKVFLALFFKRLLRPITLVWEKIYQLLPQPIKNSLTTYHLQLITLIFLLLVILANYLWPQDAVLKAKLRTAQWPILPTSHFKMAQAYFNNGYDQEAKKEFFQAYLSFRFLLGRNFFPWWQKEAVKTNQLIIKKDQIQDKIDYWEQILKNKPNFRDAYLRLSVLYYQILEDEKAKEMWNKAFYLDPNNEIIQEVGKKLETSKN